MRLFNSRIVKIHFFVLTVLCLTACGKKEVVYDADKTEGTDTTEAVAVSEEIRTYDSSKENPIAYMIGAEDVYKWKDTIELNNGGSVDINAEVYYTDFNQPIVAKVTKHSYTEDEKKRIVEALFEKDSIAIDVDNYPTKEYYQSRIEDIVEFRTKYDTAVEKHLIRSGADSGYDIIDAESEYMSSMCADAPKKEEVSKEVKNYSENYYTGTRDGVEACVVFNENDKGELYGFTYKVKNYNDVVNADNNVEFPYEYNASPLDYDNIDNKCTMSLDELYVNAEGFLKALGIENVKRTFSAVDMVWKLSNGETVTNGYKLYFGLDLDNIWYDSNYMGLYDGYVNTFTEKTYEPDFSIVMLVNDSGVIKMKLEGNVDIQNITTTTLLGYEEIQECFKEVIKKKNNINGLEYSYFQYGYMRIHDEESNNGYAYIPTWIMDNELNEPILINAIDGKEIDANKNLSHIYYGFEQWESEFDYNYQYFE